MSNAPPPDDRERLIRLETRFDHAPNHETLRRTRDDLRKETADRISSVERNIVQQIKELGMDQTVAINTAFNTARASAEESLDRRFAEYTKELKKQEDERNDRRANSWRLAVALASIAWMVFGGTGGEARAVNTIASGIPMFGGR